MARRRLTTLMTTVLLSVGLPALAHGTFVDARPLPGVVVGGVIDEVAFLFPEPVEYESAVIAVTGPDGQSVPARGRVSSPVPSAVRVGIEAITLPGEYRVDHAVSSQDGFVFEGTFTFVYGPAAPPLDPLPYGGDSRPWPWLVAGGGVLLLTTVILRRSRAWRSEAD
ncbi:MAG: copper resistance protein CopC [Acidimicrobiia bacterium]